LDEGELKMAKEYIGDGVYIDHDGFSFVLTTSNGIRDTNTIYLEPEHIERIMSYVSIRDAELARELKCES
jgi:hypothetical protein